MDPRRTAVVTGATRGIGLEVARQLARRGLRVALTGRDRRRGEEAREALARDGLATTFLELDVASAASIARFATDAVAALGRVDVLVNNAGISVDPDRPPSLAEEAEILARTFATNAVGPYLLCRALVPAMASAGYGRVVNVSSGMGQLSEMSSGDPGYRLSKSALNAVTRIFADETRGRNVLVNSACPGWVRTDMGGSAAPRSVADGADTIVWLATLPDGGPTGGFFRDRSPMAW